MTGPRRFRLLTNEEIELWRRVAETVERRAESRLPMPAKAPSPPAPKPATVPQRQPSFPAASYTTPQSAPRPLMPPLAPMERQYRKKVARGRIGIERVMDLHGLTLVQAHSALRAFLRSAQTDDLRLVLVVTGKGGRQSANEASTGVIRRAVPHWLREADQRGIVLGFEEAGTPHGGTGALYVRLRAPRG